MRGVSWTSQRGQHCPDNRDMGGYFAGEQFTFALIVDISQRGPRGADFAYEWTRHVLEGIRHHSSLSPEEVISAMKQACQALRRDYPAESGSYAAVLGVAAGLGLLRRTSSQ